MQSDMKETISNFQPDLCNNIPDSERREKSSGLRESPYEVEFSERSGIEDIESSATNITEDGDDTAPGPTVDEVTTSESEGVDLPTHVNADGLPTENIQQDWFGEWPQEDQPYWSVDEIETDNYSWLCYRCDRYEEMCSCETCEVCQLGPRSCECETCWGCHQREYECICCHRCQQLFCECLPCLWCQRSLDECECIECSDCRRVEVNCNCFYCKHCGGRGSNCTCNPCPNCKRPLPLCLCRRCRFCNGYDKEPWRTERQFGKCQCELCGICNRQPLYCTCRVTPVQVPQIIQYFPKLQVLDPERQHPTDSRYRYSGDDRLIVIRGGDVRVVVIPTWDNLKWRVNLAAITIAGRVGLQGVYQHFRSVQQRILKTSRRAMKALLSWLGHKPYIEVNTSVQVSRMVTRLAAIPQDEPNIALDLEGDNLGRDGTTCYIQIRDCYHNDTYLVDLFLLGQEAFSTESGVGQTLKSILEDCAVKKLIFDCRQDSDALFAHFGVNLAGIIDVQYMAMLVRREPQYYRIGLTNAINRYANLTCNEAEAFSANKSYQFAGDYSVFKSRPCPEELKLYAINDVVYLRKLHDELRSKLTVRAMELVADWTQQEIEHTWADTYFSSGASTPASFNVCWMEDIHTVKELQAW